MWSYDNLSQEAIENYDNLSQEPIGNWVAHKGPYNHNTNNNKPPHSG